MKTRTGWLATPYAFGLLLLVAIPLLIAVLMAFTDANLVQPPSWVGWANFTSLFHSWLYRRAVWNSLLFVAWAVPLRFLGAVVLALLLQARFAGARTFRTAVMLPTVMPDVAYALVWLWILNPFYGPLNLVLRAVGLPAPLWFTTPRNAQVAILVMSVFQLGEGFIIALAARQMVPDRYFDLAAVEGANTWTTFRRVTLPVMAPALLLLVARDTVVALQGTLAPVLLLTEGGPPPAATTTVPFFVYRDAFRYLRFGEAAAATLMLLPAMISILWLEFQAVDIWRKGLHEAS